MFGRKKLYMSVLLKVHKNLLASTPEIYKEKNLGGGNILWVDDFQRRGNKRTFQEHVVPEEVEDWWVTRVTRFSPASATSCYASKLRNKWMIWNRLYGWNNKVELLVIDASTNRIIYEVPEFEHYSSRNKLFSYRREKTWCRLRITVQMELFFSSKL